MTKKYSEEEYNQIVKAYQSKFYYPTAISSVIETVSDMRGIVPPEEIQQAILLAIPASREWAHDNFVEKEKKSHFVLKDVRDDNGNLYHLIENGGAVVLNPWLNSGYQPKIKESDVRKWGFNPEMFDREEAVVWN